MDATPPKLAAVKARRRAKPTDEEREADPREALWRTLDFFPTPPWASRAAAEHIQRLDPRVRLVREPACGEGHMVGPLEEYFDVMPSDVHAHTPNTPVIDWLDPDAWSPEPDCDFIITNPPFGIAEDFVRLGLQRARYGVALLLRLAFLEGGARHDLMDGSIRLTQIVTYSERVPMHLGRWLPENNGTATGYGLFIWTKDQDPLPPAWFGPGTRDRLWKDEDARRYGWQAPMPLFEGI